MARVVRVAWLRLPRTPLRATAEPPSRQTMPWSATRESLDGVSDSVRVSDSGQVLSRGDVLDLWRSDAGFSRFYADEILKARSEAFCWETPPVTHASLSRPHEFIVIDSPIHGSLRPDASAFGEHFEEARAGAKVVSFPNLGRDGIMIAPVPAAGVSCEHLASFLKTASDSTVAELFAITAEEALGALGDRPLWISTAGLGIPWLHVRIDTRPKYYRHAPYRSMS